MFWNNITEAVVTVLIAIIGVAILSVLVSPKSRTASVVQSLASGFGNSLAVAMTPVTGEHVRIDTSYPQTGGLYGMGGGYGIPQMGMGLPSFY